MKLNANPTQPIYILLDFITESLTKRNIFLKSHQCFSSPLIEKLQAKAASTYRHLFLLTVSNLLFLHLLLLVTLILLYPLSS